MLCLITMHTMMAPSPGEAWRSIREASSSTAAASDAITCRLVTLSLVNLYLQKVCATTVQRHVFRLLASRLRSGALVLVGAHHHVVVSSAVVCQVDGGPYSIRVARRRILHRLCYGQHNNRAVERKRRCCHASFVAVSVRLHDAIYQIE